MCARPSEAKINYHIRPVRSFSLLSFDHVSKSCLGNSNAYSYSAAHTLSRYYFSKDQEQDFQFHHCDKFPARNVTYSHTDSGDDSCYYISREASVDGAAKTKGICFRLAFMESNRVLISAVEHLLNLFTAS